MMNSVGLFDGRHRLIYDYETGIVEIEESGRAIGRARNVDHASEKWPGVTFGVRNLHLVLTRKMRPARIAS